MTPSHGATISERLAAVRARMAAACARADRDPAAVTLIAVSKTQPVEAIMAAWQAGLEDFGENYVQEAAAKSRALGAALGPATRWQIHFIGHLQTNKARAAVEVCDEIHSVDSPRLVTALETAAHGTRLPVFVQVNVAGEATKAGVSPVDAPALIARLRRSPSLTLVGLMTVPPAGPAEESRRWFRALKQLAVEHGIEGLSMGMTDDFEVAIEEGATHVRVGRAIFGERHP